MTTLPTPIGATYTVAGVQHCTITTAAPDANLYTEEQLKQFGRNLLEDAAMECTMTGQCHCNDNLLCAENVSSLKEQL